LAGMYAYNGKFCSIAASIGLVGATA
jgi:hypothetical protein